MLIPREHGAYGQLLFPLVTVLGAGRSSAVALGFAVTAISGFLAHEGLAVLFGRRGGRALRERRSAAVRSVAVFGAVGLVAGCAAFVASPPGVRHTVLATCALAAVAMWLVRAGRERTVGGEVLIAVTLASWCVPVGLAARLGVSQVIGAWAVWSAMFAVATLGVRGVIARTRQERWRALCAGAVLVGAVSWWVMHRLALAGFVAEGMPLALAPAGVLSFLSWLSSVRAHDLHRVGWTILAAGVVTLALLFRALSLGVRS